MQRGSVNHRILLLLTFLEEEGDQTTWVMIKRYPCAIWPFYSLLNIILRSRILNTGPCYTVHSCHVSYPPSSYLADDFQDLPASHMKYPHKLLFHDIIGHMTKVNLTPT